MSGISYLCKSPRCSAGYAINFGFFEALSVCFKIICGVGLDQKHFGPARGNCEPGGGYA